MKIIGSKPAPPKKITGSQGHRISESRPAYLEGVGIGDAQYSYIPPKNKTCHLKHAGFKVKFPCGMVPCVGDM